MFTSTDLKAIITEARPIIERQLDDALIVAGFRSTVTDKGGDWGQVKALLKAMIQDERDDGGTKRVTALLDKAENATAYADMLGLMNEKNSFESAAADDGEGGGEDAPASLADTSVQEGSEPIGAHNADPAGSTPAPATNVVHMAPAKSLRPYCLAIATGAVCGSPCGKKHCYACERYHAAEIRVEPGGEHIPHHGIVRA